MDSAEWDARYADQELMWSRGPNTFVAEQLSGMAPGRALDLAGGEGRNAIWLAQRGWDVELVDFSRVALDKAAVRAQQAGVTITLTLADLTASPMFEPADVVVLAYLQLPRAASTRAVRLAASSVAPGGTLLLVAHAKRNLTEGVGGPPDVEVLRSVEEFVDDLGETDLTVTVAQEVTRSVDSGEGPRDAIDVLVRAERASGPR